MPTVLFASTFTCSGPGRLVVTFDDAGFFAQNVMPGDWPAVWLMFAAYVVWELLPHLFAVALLGITLAAVRAARRHGLEATTEPGGRGPVGHAPAGATQPVGEPRGES